MNLKSEIIKCLEEIGIFIDYKENEDIDLREYINDSLQYIETIVKLENTFNISLPDDFLLFDNFSSFNALATVIENLIKDKKI